MSIRELWGFQLEAALLVPAGAGRLRKDDRPPPFTLQLQLSPVVSNVSCSLREDGFGLYRLGALDSARSGV